MITGFLTVYLVEDVKEASGTSEFLPADMLNILQQSEH